VPSPTTNRLDKLEKEMAEKKKKDFEQAQAKSEAMANALVESWGKTLDQADLTDASRATILAMAKKFPKESQEFFRVAHHASKKYQQREKELEDAVNRTKNAELKQSFNAVMNKTTHVASKKEVAPKTDESHFMDALNKYRVTGSGRALMEEVAEIGDRKRRRMF
jgi:sugar-specific transcriptional regulator TrmB